MKSTISNSKTFFYSVLLTAAIAVFSTSCSNNTTQQRESNSNNDAKIMENDATKDAHALIDFALINLEEIKLGKLAQQNAGSEDVKELGRMMEQAHTQSYNDLTVLAQSKVITLPTTLAANGDDFYNKMNTLSGSDFDKQYCSIMVNDHKKSIDMLGRLAQESRDEDIRQFATQTNAILMQHLNHAEICQNKYK